MSHRSHRRSYLSGSAAVLGALTLAVAGVAGPAGAAPPDKAGPPAHAGVPGKPDHAGKQGPPPFAKAKGQAVDIDILSINDFHGRLEDDRQVAGAAVLACAIQQFEDANENTLFVSAGDNIGASTFTSAVANDQPTLDVLNAMDLDVSAFGNHEFDQGRDDVDDRVIPASDFPYVSANIYEDGERVYDPYYVETVDGVDVAFIGAITEAMPSLVSPSGIEGLEFRDMSDEVNAVAEQLTDGNTENGEADVIVVLVHEGGAIEGGTPYGDLVLDAHESISAIISGHTHQVYSLDVDGVQVLQSASYGERMGHLEISYNPVNGSTEVSSEVIDLVAEDGTPYCAGDAEIQAIVDAAADAAEELGSVEIGEITADFNRAVQIDTDPASDTFGDPVENRGGESTIGNLIADVQLWAAQRTTDADIAFMNPGGIRTDIEYDEVDDDGAITYKEGAETQPFANTLVVMTLTGEQIVQLLEEQWQPAGSSRPFLKLGVSEGLFYTYDPEAPVDERITDVWFEGAPLDPTADYRVVANSFLASGGDNFATFTEGTDVADTGQVDLQAMVDYLDAMSPVMPDYAQRAVGVVETWSGDDLVLELSSLSFSTNEPKPAQVVASIGGSDVATAVVDSDVVAETALFDEVGRATLTIEDLATYDDDDDGFVTVDFVAGETAFSITFAV